jgi:hypothetical protein
MRTLVARGNVLERDVANVAIRQWVQPIARRGTRGRPPFDGPGELLYDIGLDTGLPAQSDLDAASLANATAWLLDTLSEESPILLAVDDLQWMDASSQRVFALLASRVPELPVVLVAAVRGGEPEATSPEVRALVDRSTVARLEPSALSPAAVARLVDERLSRDLPAFAATLHDVTGGIPFFVCEQLSSIASSMRDADEDALCTAARDRAALGVTGSIVGLHRARRARRRRPRRG